MLIKVFVLHSVGISTPPPENIPSPALEDISVSNKLQDKVLKFDPLLETRLLEYLCNPSRVVPVDSLQLANSISQEVRLMLLNTCMKKIPFRTR